MEEAERVQATFEPDEDPFDDAEETAVAVKPAPVPAPVGTDFTQPEVRKAAVDALEAQVLLIQEAMERTLKRDVHYGTIPGTQKPSLWQPGAEMLCQMFKFQTDMTRTGDHEDWDKGVFSYTYKCRLMNRDGDLITEREATCSSKEPNYSGKNAFQIRETLMQMAQKRAYVSVVRGAGAASAIFSQDDDIVPEPTPQQTQAPASNSYNGPRQQAPAPQQGDVSIPCQRGHEGEVWKSGKWGPWHSSTPKSCSMKNWIKEIYDSRGREFMQQVAGGMNPRYSQWTDPEFVQFWESYQKHQAADTPWEDEQGGSPVVEEVTDLNF